MSKSRSPRPRLSVTELEDRQTPASAAAAAGVYAVGVPDGQTGDVVVYNADGTQQYSAAAPYGATFTGGVRAALADVTGDGTADLVVAPGAGTEPLVKVYDGVTHQPVASFDAYESTFTGGVYVAAGDLNADGKAEVVVGADLGGGPRVRVFDGASVASGSTSPTTLIDFQAIDDPNFRGGVRIGLGDINADGVPDLVVGAGFGGGPRVAVYDGAALAQGHEVKLVNDFFAFEASLRNGVFPTVGDLNGDGCADLVFGAGPGGAPRVEAFDGSAMLAGRSQTIANFFAGDLSSRLGVQVGTVTAADGTTSIVGLDLATHLAAAFGADGGRRDFGPGHGHGLPPIGLPPFGGSQGGPHAPIPVTTATATAVQGTYAGTGTGGLLTFTTPGTPPTSTTPGVTLTLNITGATLDTPPNSTTAYGLTLTGSLTIAVDGSAPVTESFTGHFRLTADPATSGSTQGRLEIHAAPTAGSHQGFILGGSLDGGTLTVNGFAAISGTPSTGGTILRIPATRGGTKLTLTSSAATTTTA